MTSRSKPLILPTPREMKLLGSFVHIPSMLTFAGVSPELLNNTLPESIVWRIVSGCEIPVVQCFQTESYGTIVNKHVESYELTIDKPYNRTTVVVIRAQNELGMRNGLRTLLMLIKQYTNELPSLLIYDEPLFDKRGVMLDISRDRVPTLEELCNVIEMLALLKINHLQLYTEHTFAYQGHEAIWENSGALTANDYSKIDKFCSHKGIVLVGNQNTFGHLHRWLSHPDYSQMAEVTGDWDFYGFKKHGAFSLAPTHAQSIDFVKDLLKQFVPCFSSGIINIGGDETADIGQGASKNAVAEKGYWNVYWDFMKQVIEYNASLGGRSMIWADVLINHFDDINTSLPKDLDLLVWNYEADARFSEWVSKLKGLAGDVWVCPGTSSWRSITSRTWERRQNYIAASGSYSAGAKGFINTDWGDLGHRQTWAVSLLGIAEGAQLAWSGNSDWDQIEKSVSLHLFQDDSLTVGKLMADLGSIDQHIREIGGKVIDGKAIRMSNSSAMFVDMQTPLNDKSFIAGSHSDWEFSLKKLNPIEEKFTDIRFNKQLKREVLHTIYTAKIAIDRAILRRSGVPINSQEMADRLRKLIDEHRAIWLKRFKPQGLDDSCAHYEKVLKEFETL